MTQVSTSAISEDGCHGLLYSVLQETLSLTEGERVNSPVMNELTFAIDSKDPLGSKGFLWW